MMMVSDLIIDNTFNESLKSGLTFITFGSESSKYIPSVLTIDEWLDAESTALIYVKYNVSLSRFNPSIFTFATLSVGYQF